MAAQSQCGAQSTRLAASQRAPLVGVAGILAAASLWALVGLVAKRLYAITTISPQAVGALRLLIAMPALVALSAGMERRPWRIARRDWWLFGSMASPPRPISWASSARSPAPP